MSDVFLALETIDLPAATIKGASFASVVGIHFAENGGS